MLMTSHDLVMVLRRMRIESVLLRTIATFPLLPCLRPKTRKAWHQMGRWTQETGDDILQVDAMKPEAAPEDDPSNEKLKRTTAGQSSRDSTPPGTQLSEELGEGPSRPSKDQKDPEETYDAQE